MEIQGLKACMRRDLPALSLPSHIDPLLCPCCPAVVCVYGGKGRALQLCSAFAIRQNRQQPVLNSKACQEDTGHTLSSLYPTTGSLSVGPTGLPCNLSFF